MDDRARVAELLGRPPRGDFDVVVRDASGDPVVVRNAPFLHDGTPMPTRYYLVGRALVRAVSRIEADGGVRASELAVDAAELAAAHDRYAVDRDSAIPDDHEGPRPSGGVGGTRTGVKCLHAHVAYLLAGGEDPVGRWTLDRLDTESGERARLVGDLVVDDGLDTSVGAGSDSVSPIRNPDVGGLTLTIDDRATIVEMTGGGRWTMPIGPVSIVDEQFEHRDPPTPAQLTNALGLVHDHFDDIVIESPSVLATPSVVVAGRHAAAVARVEIGDVEIPPAYRLTRRDADEVFRTLVAEAIEDRLHNPGLDPADVETVVGTVCIVLAVMRRIDLSDIGLSPTTT